MSERPPMSLEDLAAEMMLLPGAKPSTVIRALAAQLNHMGDISGKAGLFWIATELNAVADKAKRNKQ